jgi:hypothetical protein
MEMNGSRIEMRENHLKLGNLSQLRPMNHMAHGNEKKNPTDTLK